MNSLMQGPGPPFLTHVRRGLFINSVANTGNFLEKFSSKALCIENHDDLKLTPGTYLFE